MHGDGHGKFFVMALMLMREIKLILCYICNALVRQAASLSEGRSITQQLLEGSQAFTAIITRLKKKEASVI